MGIFKLTSRDTPFDWLWWIFERFIIEKEKEKNGDKEKKS